MKLPSLFTRRKDGRAEPTVSEAAAVMAKAAKDKRRKAIRDRCDKMRADLGMPAADWGQG